MTRIWILWLLVVFAGASCRTLTEPGGGPDDPIGVRILLEDPYGTPMADAYVWITNRPYVPFPDRFDWSGQSDGNGMVRGTVPAPGRYDLETDPVGAQFHRFHFRDVQFGSELISLRPEGSPLSGRVVLPERFGPLNSSSVMVLRWEEPSGPVSIRPQVGPDGTFEAWTSAEGFRTEGRLYGDFGSFVFTIEGPVDVVDDELTIPVPVSGFDVVTTAGDHAASGTGEIRVDLLDIGSDRYYERFTSRRIVDMGVVQRVDGPEGTVRVRSHPDPLYTVSSTVVQLPRGQVVPLSLGRFRLDIGIRTEEGIPVQGATITLDGPTDRSQETAADGGVTFFADPGEYLLTLRRVSFSPEEYLDTIQVEDADLSLEYGIE